MSTWHKTPACPRPCRGHFITEAAAEAHDRSGASAGDHEVGGSPRRAVPDLATPRRSVALPCHQISRRKPWAPVPREGRAWPNNPRLPRFAACAGPWPGRRFGSSAHSSAQSDSSSTRAGTRESRRHRALRHGETRTRTGDTTTIFSRSAPASQVLRIAGDSHGSGRLARVRLFSDRPPLFRALRPRADLVGLFVVTVWAALVDRSISLWDGGLNGPGRSGSPTAIA